MPVITPFRVKPLLFGFFSCLLVVAASFYAMNAWRLWQIDQNLDFASHFASCDGLPSEAEAANCVVVMTTQYLNDASWLARMFLLLLLEAVVLGYITARLAGRERAIVVAVSALLCGLAMLSFFPHAQIAALAASCGLVLGGLLRHAQLKRQHT